ncbi:MAG: M23 family metallopeptidase [Chitinophagales bacterium]|nr:M23 family metallopeptidase [Chitinophagales bacterium]
MIKNLRIKYIVIVSALAYLFYRLFGSKKTADMSRFFAVNSTNKLRECDAFGCGHFGASRSGGTRTHKGIDFVATENQSIYAPFECKIIRYGQPYADDSKYKLVEIESTDGVYKAKIMYIKALYSVGKVVKRGELLVNADNISKKYGASMTNHVHFELYKNGILVNPTNYFV